MKPGDKFRDGHGVAMQIDSVELRELDPWVIYHNIKTNQGYSCRQEAFLLRFSPLPA